MLTPTDVHFLVGLLTQISRPGGIELELGSMVFDAVAEEVRDVDITVRATGENGAISVFEGIEVKDHTRPLDVARVEQLCAKLRDMPEITDRAVVSASGYTEPAIRKTVQEIAVPKYVEVEQPPVTKVPPPKPLLFAGVPDDELLGYGVPSEWLADVRRANEDTLLELADHLPAEAAEALLDLATGVAPKIAKPVAVGTDPFAHPDAQRRFRVMANVEELERALDYPWDKWTIFLHPAQRALVERDYGGPARVAGSAGTGKTIVALHRAAFLARANPDARVVLTTFSDALANALRSQLRRLISSEPRLGERLEVHSMNAIGVRLYDLNFGRLKIASSEIVRDLLTESANAVEGHKFSLPFLLTEWEQVVDAWQLESWESYRDVVRLGRKTRLKEAQRIVLWSIFERIRAALKARGLVTYPEVFSRVAAKLRESAHAPFEFAVVDEAQDVSVPQLRFLAALGAGRPNSLFFAGDLGQRIFQQPFSWKATCADGRRRSLGGET
jgi:hypothetical protein